MKDYIPGIILIGMGIFMFGVITGRQVEVSARQNKRNTCFKLTEAKLKETDLALFYGLPKKFSKPSYNAIKAFIEYQLNECERNQQ